MHLVDVLDKDRKKVGEAIVCIRTVWHYCDFCLKEGLRQLAGSLCDFQITSRSKICGKRICSYHAQEVGKDLDYCPDHHFFREGRMKEEHEIARFEDEGGPPPKEKEVTEDSNNPREAKHPVQEIADAVGGTITEAGRLPDGSGFAIMSMPLRKDHWIYGDRNMERKVCDTAEGELFTEPPPMVLRMGVGQEAIFAIRGQSAPPPIMTRDELAAKIRIAGKYAVRAATMKGKEMDFDPDALLQNLVVAFLGYWTEDGLSSDDWANPQDLRKKLQQGGQ